MYILPNNALTFTVSGTQYAIAAVDLSSIVILIRIGIYQNIGGIYDSEPYPIIEYTNGGMLYSDVQSKGGIVKYLSWLQSQLNSALTSIPSNLSINISYDGMEPIDDNTSVLAINTALASANIISGEIVYPPKLLSDWKDFWSNSNMNEEFPNGCGVKGAFLYRISENMCLFSMNDGTIKSLQPDTNLNTLAKQVPAIAASWKSMYGFITQ